MSSPVSAGILLFRQRDGRLEVLLAHPGGPFWERRNVGSWTIPKGLADPNEDLAAVAAREFAEETGFELSSVAGDPTRPPIALGDVTLKSRKVIHAWAVEGDLDPDLARSNEFELEWPPRSGQRIVIPEIDRVAWLEPDEARRLANPTQAEFIDRLEAELSART
jgi:predicted NUDIX family NTP pyrophosphohydrolase